MAQTNQDPKTAMLSDEDHGASITIATGLGLVYMLLTCAARLYTRHVLRGFGIEDTTILFATVRVLYASLGTRLRIAALRIHSEHRCLRRGRRWAWEISRIARISATLTARKGIPSPAQRHERVRNLLFIAELIQLAYAADILLIITLCLSKCSVILLLKGLTRNTDHYKACKMILGLSAIWGVASVFAIALRCELSHPWLTLDGHCTNLVC